MKVLVIDVGGTNIKVMMTGQSEPVKIPSGKLLTPDEMVAKVKEATHDWDYGAITLGLPLPIRDRKPRTEPVNLGTGWLGYDFAEKFDRPLKLINDAAMQAIGSYEGGHMLFIGLGTGMGTAIVGEKCVFPTELAHLPYRKKKTFEQYVGNDSLEKFGKKRWRLFVTDVVKRLYAATGVDYIVIGGGNVKQLKEVPEYVRLGSNRNAFIGGCRLWEEFSGVAH